MSRMRQKTAKATGDSLDDEDEWGEWRRLTPLERWRETQKLWMFYMEVGGSLDPEPDPQSPFSALFETGKVSSDGRTGMHILRRSRI